MVLAETPYRAIVQSEIKPFRGLLMGFFFISIGLSLEIGVLLHAWPEVLVATLVLVAAKAVLNMLASLVFRWSVPGSTQLACCWHRGRSSPSSSSASAACGRWWASTPSPY